MNNFENDTKYSLFSSIENILHPSISKMNISNYKIILEDYLYPVRVFYPEKVSDINKVIIFIHGNGKDTGCSGLYSNICSDIAINTNSLLIAIDYIDDEDIDNKLYLNVLYIYNELIDNKIDNNNIILMGDSLGANLCNNIINLSSNNKDLNINKLVLFYPKFVLEDIINNSLIITSKTDKYKNNYIDNIKESKLIEFPFANHGFLRKMEDDIKKEVYNQINSYI